jgi:hypothetical protein
VIRVLNAGPVADERDEMSEKVRKANSGNGGRRSVTTCMRRG